jgi:hypothetical protein
MGTLWLTSLMSQTPTSAASPTLCPQFLAAQVSSLLGVEATAVTLSVRTPMVTCYFKVATDLAALSISVTTHATVATFSSYEAIDKYHGNKPVVDMNFAPD